MKLIASLIPLLFSWQAHSQLLAGTWSRFDEKGVLKEVMTLRKPNHFIATLFDRDRKVVAVENGEYTIKGDSICFSFKQIISWKRKRWVNADPKEMKPVTYRMEQIGHRLIINDNKYIEDL